MKKITGILILCIAPFIIKGQDNIKFEEVYSYFGKSFSVLPAGQDKIAISRVNEKERHAEMVIISSQTFDVEKNVSFSLSKYYKKADVFYQKIINDTLFFLSSFYNRKHDKLYIFKEGFPTDGTLIGSGMRKVAELSMNSGNFEMTKKESENGTYISFLVTQGNMEFEHLAFFVFDSDLNFKYVFKKMYYPSEYVRPEKNYRILHDFLVSNDGQLFLVFRAYKDELTAGEKREIIFPEDAVSPFIFRTYVARKNYENQLVVIDSKNWDSYSLQTENEEIFLKDAFIYESNSQMILSGTFSGPDGNNADGLWMYALNSNLSENISVSEFYNFSVSQILYGMSPVENTMYENAMSGAGNLFWDYHNLKNIGSVTVNGNMLMLMEQVFDYQYYLYETRFPDLVNIYHRDRVFIAVSDSTSKISTCFIIPKRQCFGVKKWKNYSYKVVDDRLYFVYNQLSYDIQHSDNISGWIHIVEFSPGEAPKVKSVSTEEFQFPLRPENMWLPDGRVILEMQDPSNTRGVFTAYDVAPE